jgi:hypothetical protein
MAVENDASVEIRKKRGSHTMLGKASHKTATLSHISHSPGDDDFGSSFWRQQC